MEVTLNTLSNNLTLSEVLSRLAASESVDGVAMFGSQASSGKSPISDYDLLILVENPPVSIFQMLTHIDQRMADVVFVETEAAERVLTLTAPVPTTSFDGLLLLKMQTARILYDASGRLQRVQDMLIHEKQVTELLQPSSYTAMYTAWFWHNHGLIHMKRMLLSDDPVYQTAVDMMLLTGLSGLCRAYYCVRHLPWQGEKAAIRYLQDHDPGFLAGLRDCIAWTDRKQKLRTYEQLVEDALAPAGGLWAPTITAVYLRDAEQHAEDVGTALSFWESLLSSRRSNDLSKRPHD